MTLFATQLARQRFLAKTIIGGIARSIETIGVGDATLAIKSSSPRTPSRSGAPPSATSSTTPGGLHRQLDQGPAPRPQQLPALTAAARDTPFATNINNNTTAPPTSPSTATHRSPTTQTTSGHYGIHTRPAPTQNTPNIGHTVRRPTLCWYA
jgi:hypothetical protein